MELKQIPFVFYSKPKLVICFLISIFVSFLLQIKDVNLSLLPQTSTLGFKITTELDNVGAEEIDKLVTYPLLDSLGRIKNVKSIFGESSFGKSEIELLLSAEGSSEETAEKIQELIFEVRDALPPPTKRSIVSRKSAGLSPFYEIMFDKTNLELNPNAMKELEDLKKEIQKVDGISSVEIKGQTSEVLLFSLNSKEISSYPVNLHSLEKTIQNFQRKDPIGIVENDNNSVLLQLQSEFQLEESISKIPIHTSTIKRPIHLQKMVQIFRYDISKIHQTRFNGRDILLLRVNRLPDFNPLELRHSLDGILKKFEITKDGTLLFDESEYLTRQIYLTAIFTILVICIASAVSFLYYKSFLYSIFLLISVFFGILFSFHFFLLFSVQMNLLTLCGLGLGLGLMFDSSNVVIYSIHSYLQQGIERTLAVKKGTEDVLLSLVSATGTTVIVFIPILIAEHALLSLFSDFAIILCSLILSAFLSAVVVVPILFITVNKVSTLECINDINYYNIGYFKQSYLNLLGKLNIRFVSKILLVGVLICIFSSHLGLRILPKMPHLGTNLRFEADPYLNEGEWKIFVLNLEVRLRKQLPNHSLLILPGDLKLESWNLFTTDFIIRPSLDASEILEIKNKIQNPQIRFKSFTIRNLIEDAFPLEFADSIFVSSMDPNRVLEISNIIQTEVSEQGLILLSNFINSRTKVKIQSSPMYSQTDFGVNMFDFVNYSQSKYQPKYLGKSNESVPTNFFLSLDYLEESSHTNMNEFKNYSGELVHLRGLRQEYDSYVFTKLFRMGNLYFSKFELPSGTSFSFVKNKIDDFSNRFQDEDVKISFTHFSDEKEEFYCFLLFLLIVSLIFLYLFLTAVYSSYLQPIFLLTPSVFLLVFMIPLIHLFDGYFHFGVYLSFLLLLGVTVDNSSLFLEKWKTNFKENKTLHSNLYETLDWYISPVILNHLTSILGIVPVLLFGFQGMEIQYSFALYLGSGFLISLCINLFVTPIVFLFFVQKFGNQCEG